MRFYFGFSKRIPIKWILLAIGAILAFFGISKVHALTVTDLSPIACYDFFGSNGYNITFSNVHGYYDKRLNSSVLNSTIDYYVLPYVQNNYSQTDSSNDLPGNTTIFPTQLCYSQSENTFSIDLCLDCIYDNGYYICPNQKNYYISNFRLIYNTINTRSTLYIPQYICGYALKNDHNTQVIIDNNNQNTQDIIDSQNNINSSLNDSNVDSSSTSGGGFFGDFEISDDRGITSIVNAPIQFLRDLLTSNSMCTPVSFDLNMSDDNISVSNSGLTLPCGSVLWNRVPEPIQLMWTWLIYGLATYRILVDLFKFWENSINPEYTKSYIMKL